MKRRASGQIEVFSLSAIDIFASAMGAFIIISIILMRDYQKVVKAEDDYTHLEMMVEDISDEIADTESLERQLREKIAAARAQLSEIESRETELLEELAKAAKAEKGPEEKPQNIDTVDESQVTFRMLGMKTAKRKLLIVYDMNRYLDRSVLENTLVRIVESLQDYHQFGLLGYQFVGGREVYHRWPTGGGFKAGSRAAKRSAIEFVGGSMSRLGGGNSLLGAVERGIGSGAEALIVVSDGLAGPRSNRGINGLGRIASRITNANKTSRKVEINTVLIGDFFDYEAIVVEAMESIAKKNDGSFLALLP